MNGILERTTGGSLGSTSSMPISHSVIKIETMRIKIIIHGWAAMAPTPERLCVENIIA
jgi:hypothetical protein